MLALSCGLLWAAPAKSANEMRFSDLEARIAAVEHKTSAIPGLKSAAFLSDGDAIDAVAPNASIQSSGDEELSSPVPSPIGARIGGRSSGYCCSSCECGSTCECGGECCECEGVCQCKNQPQGSYYAQIDTLFLRTHMMENVVGKLSEKYEFTPRFILGYETENGVGARMRWFTYGRFTDVLSTEDEQLRFEFSYLDFEATSKFKSGRSELVMSGGLRFAGITSELDEESVELTAPGMTIAAEFRSMLCGDCKRQWAAVGSARWSVLGGDWEGSDDGLVSQLRDDNIVVQEVYFGAEYSCHYCDYVLWARLVLELQNWHSDVLSQDAGVDSISLLGPGFHFGGAF